MKFFDLRELSNQLDGDSNLPSAQLLGFVDQKIRDASMDWNTIHYSRFDLETFIFTIQQENGIIFYDWVLTDSGLKSLLIDGVISTHTPVNKHSGHLLEKEFHAFLTPFLSVALKESLRESAHSADFQLFTTLLQYALLLQESEQLMIQNDVKRTVQSFFEDRFLLPDQLSEEGILHQLSFLKDESFVACMNLFDKSLYSFKISFLKRLELFSEHPNATSFVLQVFRKNLMRLNLNPGHKEELEGFLSESTKVKANRFSQRKRSQLMRFGLPLLLIGLFCALIVGLINWGNGTSVPKVVVRNQSGLDSLTADELRAVDTLLGMNLSKEDLQLERDEADDMLLIPSFVFPSVVIKNTIAKALHSSMVKDYGIQENSYFNDPCQPVPLPEYSQVNYEHVLMVDQLSGPFHKIKNESEYQVYVLVFDNDVGGKLFGKLVPAGGAMSVGLKTGQFLFFYIGKEMSRFNPAKEFNNGYGSIQTAKEVDPSFVFHYCMMDYHSLTQLGKIYQVDATNLAQTTVLSGGYSNGFSVNSTCLALQK